MKLWSLAVLQSPYFEVCVLYNGSWHVFSTMVHDTDYRNARGLRYRGVRKSLAWQQGSVSNLQLSSHRGVSRWVIVGQRSVETKSQGSEPMSNSRTEKRGNDRQHNGIYLSRRIWRRRMHINWSVKRISVVWLYSLCISVVRLYSFIIIAMLELLVVMASVLTSGHLQR